MLSYIEIALINAVVVIPLALLALVVDRLFRRPALTHLLWVLVLIKLVIPPVLQIPLIDGDWLQSVARQFVRPVAFNLDQIELSSRLSYMSRSSAGPLPPVSRPRTLANTNKRPGVVRASAVTVIKSWLGSENLRQLASAGLLVAWSVGSALWFCIQGIRCIRFRWSLRHGTIARTELQRYADQLARRLGLAYSPTVWLMPGVMSPMLWGSGRSTLLIFPERLLDRLDLAAVGTLLTHELAHFRRRDHWVRVVALMATGFFWWHPVVWWARREIEAVEEECCDALVVLSAAVPAKTYAEAILDVVDLLTERQRQLPPLATGLGQIPFLRQRLTWIMRGPRQQNLGYSGRLLCLFLVGSLPLQPYWLTARAATTSPAPSIRLPPIKSSGPQTQSVAASTDPAGGIGDVIATTEAAAAISANAGDSPQKSVWKGAVVRSHSSDGRFVAMGNELNLCLLDLETGRELGLNDFSIRAMAFARNGYQFVTLGEDDDLCLWNAESLSMACAWRVAVGGAKSVDISPNGRWIAVGGRDGVVRIWSVTNSQPVRELPREDTPVNCVRFSPNGELLGVATGDGTSPQSGRIALIDIESWTERISMNWNSPTAVIAFPPDNESLVSGDWRGRIARWSVLSGELLGLAVGKQDLIAAEQFSPNGSALSEVDVPNLLPSAAWNATETFDAGGRTFGSWLSDSSLAPLIQPSLRTPPM